MPEGEFCGNVFNGNEEDLEETKPFLVSSSFFSKNEEDLEETKPFLVSSSSVFFDDE